jgi:gluconolactonase
LPCIRRVTGEQTVLLAPQIYLEITMKKILLALALLNSSVLYADEMTPQKFKELKSSISELKSLSTTEQTPKKVTGLKSPESVLQTNDGTIYISEIGEFGKDGDGQISKINKDGITSVFAKGLDDPKGLTMIGSTLYVADKTKIIEVAPDGSTKLFIDSKAFPKTPQFLNDLASDNYGNLYVSDSGDLSKGGAIYKISNDKKVSVVADSNNPNVLAPNGLLYEGRNTLLEVDFASGVLYRINLASGDMTKIADGFGGGDGIVKTKTGKIYISDWKNGMINQVSAGKAKLINNGLESSADIAISHDGKYLLVPLMKPGELAYIAIK